MSTIRKPVSQRQFYAYKGVQESGLTNMCNIPAVIRIAEMQYMVKLTRGDCLYIMNNYRELEKEYNNQTGIPEENKSK